MAPADGDDGEDGTSILITTSSSTSCANGGNTFNIGPDSNSNGFLEASEVVMNVDVCNGAQGPMGPQGPAGADGADGQDGNDASIGFQMTYQGGSNPVNMPINISSFNTYTLSHMNTSQKNSIDLLVLSTFDLSNSNQSDYIESFKRGDILQIRNNDDYATYMIDDIFMPNSAYPDIYLFLSMLSMSGNYSFSPNNDYSFIFDSSYSPIYENTSANTYYNEYFTISYSGGLLDVSCIPLRWGYNFSVYAVNHHAGTTHYATSTLGTTATLNIGGGDIIEIFIIHNSPYESWDAYEITIIDYSHFFVNYY
mgnify:CR=1 FL=1